MSEKTKEIMDSERDEAMVIDSESRKRKQEGGSSGVSPSLKKTNSLTDMQAYGASMSSRAASGSVLDSVAAAFQDQPFIDKITPSLRAIMQPLMTQAINDAVTNAVTKLEKDVIKPLKQHNDELRKHVKEQEQLIKEKDELLALKNVEITKLVETVDNLSFKLDDLEQYGRRSSLRLFNVPADPDLSCDEIVVNTVRNMLKVQISVDDIERAHRLGKPNTYGNCPIIVKFKSYQTKARVYSAKSQLKGNREKIFLTEDLTKMNHSIVVRLLELRSANQIHAFWTQDGKIYYKSTEDERPIRVRNISLLPDVKKR